MNDTAERQPEDAIAPCTGNLRQRIRAIMMEIDYVQKTKLVGSSTSPQSYKAVTHDNVVAAVRPFMIKHGVALEQTLIEGKLVDTGKFTSGGTPIVRFEATYDMTFVNVDSPEDKFTVREAAHADDQGDKAPGKAASYAKKGALLRAFLLETGTESEEERIAGQPEPKPTERQRPQAKSAQAAPAAAAPTQPAPTTAPPAKSEAAPPPAEATAASSTAAAASPQGAAASAERGPPAAKTKIAFVRAKLKELKVAEAAVCERLKIEALDTLTDAECTTLIKWAASHQKAA